MFLAFHPFELGPYEGMLVATGMPRPAAPKSIWNLMFSDFNEILHKGLTDSSNTPVPGVADVLEGNEGAIKLEGARAHCLRKFQKDFQGSLCLAVASNFKATEEAVTAFFLPHPAFSFAFLETNGDLQEILTSGVKSGAQWFGIEKSEASLLTLVFKNPNKEGQKFDIVRLHRDRCFRLSTFLRNSQQNPLFCFESDRSRIL